LLFHILKKKNLSSIAYVEIICIYGLQVRSVNLDQFVCDIASPPCPEGCRCVKRPSDLSFIVTCQDVKRLPIHLPDTASPPPYRAKYVLQFAGSGIDIVEYREYFNNTRALDVSQSAVTNVSDDAWRALVKLSDIDLSSNQLTVLPNFLQTDNLTFQSISLHNNPWRCECKDRWVRNWLASLGSGLKRQDAILCYNPETLRGRSVLSVKDEEFCYDPFRQNILMTLKVCFCLTFSSSIAGAIIYIRPTSGFVTILSRYKNMHNIVTLHTEDTRLYD
jgi:hypothetical protein